MLPDFEEQQGNNFPIATPIHKVCNISVEAGYETSKFALGAGMTMAALVGI